MKEIKTLHTGSFNMKSWQRETGNKRTGTPATVSGSLLPDFLVMQSTLLCKQKLGVVRSDIHSGQANARRWCS